MNTIVLTGGGTAGHCMPCFALLPELKKRFDEIYYIGGKGGIEAKLAKKYGITFFYVPAVKLERKFTLKNALIPFKLVKAVSEAEHLLKNLKPSVVFSKGGYISLPVVVAAAKLKITVISHESDLTLGLANKIALRYSEKLLTGFKETAEGIKNAEYTGIPVDPAIFKERNKNSILKKFGLDARKKTLLITGGSQGSSAINAATNDASDKLREKYNLIWLTGKGKLKPEYKGKRGVYVAEFAENMGEVYAAADMCVSRAGASTLFEVIALGLPTVAIPLPKGNSRGDQIENAEYFARKGAIKVLKEENLNPESLVRTIEKIDDERQKYVSVCSKLNLSAANEKIAEILARA